MSTHTLYSTVKLFAVVLVLCNTIGCGNSQPTFPVKGQVVYPDGSTLPMGGKVVFQTADIDPPVTAKSYFDSSGYFELSTFREGDGAVAGKYEVAVFPTVPDDRGTMSQAEYMRALTPIADQYKSAKHSGIEFTVSAETSPHDFRVEVRLPASGKPRRRSK